MPNPSMPTGDVQSTDAPQGGSRADSCPSGDCDTLALGLGLGLGIPLFLLLLANLICICTLWRRCREYQAKKKKKNQERALALADPNRRLSTDINVSEPGIREHSGQGTLPPIPENNNIGNKILRSDSQESYLEPGSPKLNLYESHSDPARPYKGVNNIAFADTNIEDIPPPFHTAPKKPMVGYVNATSSRNEDIPPPAHTAPKKPIVGYVNAPSSRNGDSAIAKIPTSKEIIADSPMLNRKVPIPAQRTANDPYYLNTAQQRPFPDVDKARRQKVQSELDVAVGPPREVFDDSYYVSSMPNIQHRDTESYLDMSGLT